MTMHRTPGTTESTAPRRGRPPMVEARRNILESLSELLAATNADAISVEAIVRHAGVSRALFYKHFDSRDSALVELFSEVADGIRQEVLSALRGTSDPRSFIENGVRTYLQALTNLGRLAPAFDSAQYRLPEMYERREAAVRSYMDEVAHMLEHAGLPPISPLLLEGLIAAVDRVGQRIAASQVAIGEPADVDGVLQESVHTLAIYAQLYLESA